MPYSQSHSYVGQNKDKNLGLQNHSPETSEFAAAFLAEENDVKSPCVCDCSNACSSVRCLTDCSLTWLILKQKSVSPGSLC